MIVFLRFCPEENINLEAIEPFHFTFICYVMPNGQNQIRFHRHRVPIFLSYARCQSTAVPFRWRIQKIDFSLKATLDLNIENKSHALLAAIAAAAAAATAAAATPS